MDQMRDLKEGNANLAPSADKQRDFWDAWNKTHRLKPPDAFMARQREVAVQWATHTRPLSILEVGCGTGWLCDSLRQYGGVTGIDLSPASIEEARGRFPGIRFFQGDFECMEFDAHDFVISADVIAHVVDQERFVQKVAKWTRPGGTFVLMTQNPFVWNRSSYLMPQGEGQIRAWPSLRRVACLLRPWFRIRHVSSIVPGGDMGVLRLANSKLVTGGLRRLIGPRLATELYEGALIGRELVVVSTRR